MIIKGKVFAISGSSGAGKTTLVNKVLELLPDFRKVKTYTTRPIRSGEVPGLDYHFISEDVFKRRQAEGFFIETSHAYGNFYGSAKDSVKDIEFGFSLIYILDYQGCVSLKEYFPEAKAIWIDVDLDTLINRIKKRGCKESDLQQRINIAKSEMSFNKTNIFDFFIKNTTLEYAIEELVNILNTASKAT